MRRNKKFNGMSGRKREKRRFGSSLKKLEGP